MRKPILFYLLFALVGFSCKQDETLKCSKIDDPLTEIVPLSKVVNGTSDCIIYAGAKIYSCDYKNDKIFYFTNNASSLGICGGIAYNCFGEEILNSVDTRG